MVDFGKFWQVSILRFLTTLGEFWKVFKELPENSPSLFFCVVIEILALKTGLLVEIRGDESSGKVGSHRFGLDYSITVVNVFCVT